MNTCLLFVALTLGQSPQWGLGRAVDGVPADLISWDVSHDGSAVAYVDGRRQAWLATIGDKNVVKKKIPGVTPWVVFDDDTEAYMTAAQKLDQIKVAGSKPTKLKFYKYDGHMRWTKGGGNLLFWAHGDHRPKEVHTSYYQMIFVASFDGWQAFANPVESDWQHNVDMVLVSSDGTRAFAVSGHRLTTWKVEEPTQASNPALKPDALTWVFGDSASPPVQYMAASGNGDVLVFSGRSGLVFRRRGTSQLPLLSTDLIKDYTGFVRAMAVSPDGAWVVVSFTAERNAGVNGPPEKAFIHYSFIQHLDDKPLHLFDHESAVVDVHFLDEATVVCACRNSLKLFSLAHGVIEEVAKLDMEGVNQELKLSEDKKVLVALQQAKDKSRSFVRYHLQASQVARTEGD